LKSEDEGKIWVVLVAGSKGWGDYGIQVILGQNAKPCKLYNIILLNKGECLPRLAHVR
jgi:hypothetical protein